MFKISVIIPTFNSQSFLGYVLMSILDYIDEIIIIDMSSIDNTQNIVKCINSPKIRFFLLKDIVKTKQEFNLDFSINYGLRLCQGDVVMRIDDDWIWGDEIRNLRHYCERGFERKKRGLRGVVYNLLTTNSYFLPIREHYVAMFKQDDDPLKSFGSYQTDNNAICHKSEIKRSSNRNFTLFKRSRYLGTPLSFGHWKFLKDTREAFIYKWMLFTGCDKGEAAEKWSFYHKQPTELCPNDLLRPLYLYRDKFTPLGGFDVTR